jgi:hypothetical protein
MKVRFIGFSFSIDKTTLNLDDYINYMITKREIGHDLGEHKRYIFFNTTHSNSYYVGLLLTVKDQKTFCELVENSGKFVVKVNELDANSDLMDFNFFVIHKKTGLGMYQYYHQSCSTNLFGQFNNRLYSDYRDTIVNKEILELSDNKKRDSEEKIKKKYKGYLKWEILVRKENLKSLIEELAQVKSFEYRFLTLVAIEPEFKPLENYLTKERTKLYFSSDSPIKSLAESIVNFVTRRNIDSGKVIGKDIDGVDRVLRISNNPDNFGEYEYDDIATKINSLDVEKFEDSWVIRELLDKCDEYKYIFETKSK